MSSTILTVIVLVVMWLVVLVPMFARRREEADETRSIEKFSSAMRVLARRPSAMLTAAPPVGATGDTGVSRPMPAARAEMLARRRRTLGTLLMLAALTLVLSVGWSSKFWVVQLAADALLVGYLWWLRAEAGRERERRARRATHRPQARRQTGEAHAAPPRVDAVRRARTNVASAAPVTEEPAEPVDEAADNRWEPRPVPLPTYVTAPPARQSLVQDDAYQGAVELDEQDPYLSGFVDEREDQILPPRAVNG